MSTLYNRGSVSIDMDSTNVVGLNTLWDTDIDGTARYFKLNTYEDPIYEVDSIIDSTTLTLKYPYRGTSVASAGYQMVTEWTTNYNLPQLGTSMYLDAEAWFSFSLSILDDKIKRLLEEG